MKELKTKGKNVHWISEKFDISITKPNNILGITSFQVWSVLHRYRTCVLLEIFSITKFDILLTKISQIMTRLRVVVRFVFVSNEACLTSANLRWFSRRISERVSSALNTVIYSAVDFEEIVRTFYQVRKYCIKREISKPRGLMVLTV